jgi:predicted GIY-YIG superfamily endonuclease
MQQYEHRIEKSNMVDNFSSLSKKDDTGNPIYPVYIYTLSDNDGIRYVGQTNDPRTRLSRHRYNSSSGKDKTQRGTWLKKCNQNFSMTLVEKCHPSIANEREQFWISFFVDKGCVLFNRESKSNGLSTDDDIAESDPSNNAPNTKDRNAQLAKTARNIIGQNSISDAIGDLRPLVKEMMRQTGCSIPAAKRHIKNCLSGTGETQTNTRGGTRIGSGRQKR